jgi:hypothetical protein
MCIGIASMMPLTHFPSVAFDFSHRRKKNKDESENDEEDQPSSLEEYKCECIGRCEGLVCLVLLLFFFFFF